MSKKHAHLIAKFPDMGREIWAKYDPESEVFELFASQDCDDYLGCADSGREAVRVAHDIAEEWMCL